MYASLAIGVDTHQTGLTTGAGIQISQRQFWVHAKKDHNQTGVRR